MSALPRGRHARRSFRLASGAVACLAAATFGAGAWPAAARQSGPAAPAAVAANQAARSAVALAVSGRQPLDDASVLHPAHRRPGPGGGAGRAAGVLRANGADTRPLFRFPFGDVNSRVLVKVTDRVLAAAVAGGGRSAVGDRDGPDDGEPEARAVTAMTEPRGGEPQRVVDEVVDGLADFGAERGDARSPCADHPARGGLVPVSRGTGRAWLQAGHPTARRSWSPAHWAPFVPRSSCTQADGAAPQTRPACFRSARRDRRHPPGGGSDRLRRARPVC